MEVQFSNSNSVNGISSGNYQNYIDDLLAFSQKITGSDLSKFTSKLDLDGDGQLNSSEIAAFFYYADTQLDQNSQLNQLNNSIATNTDGVMSAQELNTLTPDNIDKNVLNMFALNGFLGLTNKIGTDNNLESGLDNLTNSLPQNIASMTNIQLDNFFIPALTSISGAH